MASCALRQTLEAVFAQSKTSNGEPQSVAVPREENATAVKVIKYRIAEGGIQPGKPIDDGHSMIDDGRDAKSR